MVGEDNNQGAGGSGGGAAGDQGAGSAGGGDTLDAVIGAYVATAKQLPGVIPELITGKTLNEVNASIDKSKVAFKNVADKVSGAAAGGGGAAAGGTTAIGTGAAGSSARGGGGGGSDEPAKITSEGAFQKILAGIEGKNRQSR